MSVLLIGLLLISTQVVQTGHPSPNYCSQIEHIRPNLDIAQPAQVRGTITDGQGAPLKNSRVELRKYISEKKQTSFVVVKTDTAGHYDLGTVPAGRYRLLGSATRAFKQPETLKCSSVDCELNITLQVNATDQPDSICPVR
jgi:hypothetical protein